MKRKIVGFVLLAAACFTDATFGWSPWTGAQKNECTAGHAPW